LEKLPSKVPIGEAPLVDTTKPFTPLQHPQEGGQETLLPNLLEVSWPIAALFIDRPQTFGST